MTGRRLVLLVALGLLAVACQLVSETDVVNVASEVAAVEIGLTSGNVTVLGVDEEQPTITRSITYGGERRPDDILHYIDGDTLHVEARCPPGARSCRIDHTVRVARSTRVGVLLGSGDISIRDLSGSVDLDVASGRVTLNNVAGDVRLVSQSGDLEGLGLAGGRLEADLADGGVVLSFVDAPELVDVAAEGGDVELTVPNGTYRLQLDGAAVELNGVSDEPSADRAIIVETSGTVRILGR